MRKFADTLVCLALALIIVGAWLTAPFAVVSGSMTPTLLGPHRAFDCERCGKRNVFAVETPVITGFRPACNACGETGPQLDLIHVAPGDRMLVDYTTLLFREPRRWEVVALRLPETASRIAVASRTSTPRGRHSTTMDPNTPSSTACATCVPTKPPAPVTSSFPCMISWLVFTAGAPRSRSRAPCPES